MGPGGRWELVGVPGVTGVPGDVTGVPAGLVPGVVVPGVVFRRFFTVVSPESFLPSTFLLDL